VKKEKGEEWRIGATEAISVVRLTHYVTIPETQI
jgi:hypothetical protein